MALADLTGLTRLDCVEIEQFGPPVATLHRTLIEAQRREILNGQQWERRRVFDVDHFRVTAASSAQLNPPLRLLHIRRCGDEIAAGISAIDAAVRCERPLERAVRTPKRPLAAVRFDERRPRAAERTVPAVPGWPT